MYNLNNQEAIIKKKINELLASIGSGVLVGFIKVIPESQYLQIQKNITAHVRNYKYYLQINLELGDTINYKKIVNSFASSAIGYLSKPAIFNKNQELQQLNQIISEISETISKSEMALLIENIFTILFGKERENKYIALITISSIPFSRHGFDIFNDFIDLIRITKINWIIFSFSNLANVYLGNAVDEAVTVKYDVIDFEVVTEPPPRIRLIRILNKDGSVVLQKNNTDSIFIGSTNNSHIQLSRTFFPSLDLIIFKAKDVYQVIEFSNTYSFRLKKIHQHDFDDLLSSQFDNTVLATEKLSIDNFYHVELKKKTSVEEHSHIVIPKNSLALFDINGSNQESAENYFLKLP